MVVVVVVVSGAAWVRTDGRTNEGTDERMKGRTG